MFLIKRRSWKQVIYLHEDIDVRIGFNICVFLSSWQLCQHLCNSYKKTIINQTRCQNDFHLYIPTPLLMKLTIMWSNSLASCRESQGFSNCHFPNMNIILTDISRCSFGYKLMQLMAIICHLPRALHLQNLNLGFDTRLE